MRSLSRDRKVKTNNIFQLLVDFIDPPDFFLPLQMYLFAAGVPNISFEFVLRIDGRKQAVSIEQHLRRIEITWTYFNWHLDIINLLQKGELHGHSLMLGPYFVHTQDQLLPGCIQAFSKQLLCLSVAHSQSIQSFMQIFLLLRKIVHDNFFDVDQCIYLLICRECHLFDVLRHQLETFVDGGHFMEAVLVFAEHAIGAQQFVLRLAKDGDSTIVLQTSNRVS